MTWEASRGMRWDVVYPCSVQKVRVKEQMFEVGEGPRTICIRALTSHKLNLLFVYIVNYKNGSCAPSHLLGAKVNIARCQYRMRILSADFATIGQRPYYYCYCYCYYYYYCCYFNLTTLQIGFYPVAMLTTIRHNTQKYTYHRK
jgi:hypothetical protein